MSKTKVIALVEARVVTGPAKNILRFAADCRDHVDLTVVTFARTSEKNRSAAPNGELVSAARSLNLSVETIWETGRFDLSVLTTLRQICERHEAGIIQTHSIKSHFLVSLLRRRECRWVAFHHGYTSEDPKMRFYKQFDRWSLRTADSVVTVCAPFASELAHRGVRPDRIVVVPNSVKHVSAHRDAELAKETRERFGISAGELVVFTAGRLSPEKGHCYLIEAVSKIISSMPQLKLQVLMAGAGPLDGKLKDEISKRGLEHRVRLIGHCRDVASLFSIADLFVLPSLSEGSPNVLLESMAACVPIVATNVGGVPDIVSDGESAIIVPPANADALGKAILGLLVDPARARQLASVAHERARVVFNPAKYDERILNIYEKVLHGQRHGNQFAPSSIN